MSQKRLLAWLCALAWLIFWSSPAQATRRDLVVRLGAADDPPPTDVCVSSIGVNPYSTLNGKPLRVSSTDKGASITAVGDVRLEPAAPQASQLACLWHPNPDPPAAPAAPACDFDKQSAAATKASLADAGMCEPTFTMPAGAFSCAHNELPSRQSEQSVAIIQVEETIADVHLIGNELRIGFDLTAQRKDLKTSVRVIGGHFAPVSTTPTRQIDGSESASLRLLPLCTAVAVHVPPFECPASRTPNAAPLPRLLTWRTPDGIRRLLLSNQGDDFELTVPARANAQVELATCGDQQHFSAEWKLGSSADVRFQPTKFSFDWRLEPLSDPKTCPTVKIDQGECPGIQGVPGLCRYQCGQGAPLSLPATARFSQHKQLPGVAPGAQNQAPDEWSLLLTHPGEVLEGYLPAERRYLLFRRLWSDDNRVNRWGDRLYGIDIQTPDGKKHSLTAEVERLSVPNLQVYDSVTYQYDGMRPFKVQRASVQAGGVVCLAEPDGQPGVPECGEAKVYADQHQRKLQPGLGLWVGWRGVAGARDSTRWNPSGGVEFALGFPVFRWYLAKNSLYLEPELHVGLTVSSIAFESVFSDQGRDTVSWSNVPVLVLPLELGVKVPTFTDEVEFGVGLGATWTHQVFAADQRRVEGGFSLSLPRLDLIWHVSRTFGIGGMLRYLASGAERVQIRLDQGGVASREILDTQILQGGLLARWDDVF